MNARRMVWATVLGLCAFGILGAVLRVAHLGDSATRFESIRVATFKSFGVTDASAADRPAALHRFDSRYRDNPRMTLLHILPGAAFLLFAPLQFYAPLRNRYRSVHRWSGRMLLCIVAAGTASALYFGLFMPFARWRETVVVVVMTTLLVGSGVLAWLAIRRNDVAHHREWMLRMFAVAVGIATVRAVGAADDLLAAPRGVDAETTFVLALIIGWAITLGATEIWIMKTRKPAASAREGTPEASPAWR